MHGDDGHLLSFNKPSDLINDNFNIWPSFMWILMSELHWISIRYISCNLQLLSQYMY